jgi:hypothetical protein
LDKHLSEACLEYRDIALKLREPLQRGSRFCPMGPDLDFCRRRGVLHRLLCTLFALARCISLAPEAGCFITRLTQGVGHHNHFVPCLACLCTRLFCSALCRVARSFRRLELCASALITLILVCTQARSAHTLRGQLRVQFFCSALCVL